MKYLIAFLLVAFLISCQRQALPAFSYNQSKNPWIDAFKDRVFFSAIKEAYKYDTIFYLIQQKDALNPFDGLSHEAILTADKIGRDLIANIPDPVMSEKCPKGMNYFMATSLHYYVSKDLDSIASKWWKLQVEIDKNNKLLN